MGKQDLYQAHLQFSKRYPIPYILEGFPFKTLIWWTLLWIGEYEKFLQIWRAYSITVSPFFGQLFLLFWTMNIGSGRFFSSGEWSRSSDQLGFRTPKLTNQSSWLMHKRWQDLERKCTVTPFLVACETVVCTVFIRNYKWWYVNHHMSWL